MLTWVLSSVGSEPRGFQRDGGGCSELSPLSPSIPDSGQDQSSDSHRFLLELFLSLVPAAPPGGSWTGLIKFLRTQEGGRNGGRAGRPDSQIPEILPYSRASRDLLPHYVLPINKSDPPRSFAQFGSAPSTPFCMHHRSTARLLCASFKAPGSLALTGLSRAMVTSEPAKKEACKPLRQWHFQSASNA
jgi:hypothetical protein